jgi:GTP-binding protein
MNSAVVAIVGRPNVGKSSLFNRMVGHRMAIESDIPGTTRDRLYRQMDLEGIPVMMVDTGGLELNREDGDIEANIQAQSHIAIQGADLILWVVDIRHPLTSEDFHAADLLRRAKKPVVLVANKCDNAKFAEETFNLYELGFGEPIPVSAAHGSGIENMENQMHKELKKMGFTPQYTEEEPSEGIKIAFLGRPNVGKSTLVNALLGEERVVTSEIAGTTRDAAHVPFRYQEEDFTLIDTAGMRRRGRIEKGIEKYSILRTLQSASEAEIGVLVMDFEEGVTNQDCHVSEYILEEKKGLIIVVNKIDIKKGEEREDSEQWMIHHLKAKMAYVPWAPVVFASAKEKKHIFKILDLAIEVHNQRRKVIPQDQLDYWLQKAMTKHAPTGGRGRKRFAVLSVEQISTGPPHFSFECDWPEHMHFSYARFLENELRATFGFGGTSMKLSFRKPSDRGRRRNSKP